MFIKRKNIAGNIDTYLMLLSLKKTNKKINFTPDNFVRCEAVSVKHNSSFVEHYPISGALDQA